MSNRLSALSLLRINHSTAVSERPLFENVWITSKEKVKLDLNKIKTEEDVIRATLEIEGYTEFDSRVYSATFKIPKGKISTYGRIAKMIGSPKAYRAVANSLHKNPLFPVVACHRVVKEDGSFGGDRKRAEGRCKHCEEEGVPIVKGKVQMHPEIIY